MNMSQSGQSQVQPKPKKTNLEDALNANVWDVNEHVQALIRTRAAVDVGLLSDPDTPLAELAAAAAGS